MFQCSPFNKYLLFIGAHRMFSQICQCKFFQLLFFLVYSTLNQIISEAKSTYIPLYQYFLVYNKAQLQVHALTHIKRKQHNIDRNRKINLIVFLAKPGEKEILHLSPPCSCSQLSQLIEKKEIKARKSVFLLGDESFYWHQGFHRLPIFNLIMVFYFTKEI